MARVIFNIYTAAYIVPGTNKIACCLLLENSSGILLQTKEMQLHVPTPKTHDDLWSLQQLVSQSFIDEFTSQNFHHDGITFNIYHARFTSSDHPPHVFHMLRKADSITREIYNRIIHDSF